MLFSLASDMSAATVKQSQRRRIPTCALGEKSDTPANVHAAVQERLSNCPYAYCFNQVTWSYIDSTVILEGRVGTFYLKQVLQTMLQGIEDVKQVANKVDVVSSTGLSSERVSQND